MVMCSPKEPRSFCILYSRFATANCDPIAGSPPKRAYPRSVSNRRYVISAHSLQNLGGGIRLGKPPHAVDSKQICIQYTERYGCSPRQEVRGPMPGTPSLTRQE